LFIKITNACDFQTGAFHPWTTATSCYLRPTGPSTTYYYFRFRWCHHGRRVQSSVNERQSWAAVCRAGCWDCTL